MEEYTIPVHRSIMKRKLIFGVPFVPLMIIGLGTILILMNFKLLAIIPLSLLLIYIMREITKKDEFLLENFLGSLLQPDYLDWTKIHINLFKIDMDFFINYFKFIGK